MIEVKYKPMSVNLAWQGRRFKTKAYQKYEKDLLFLLPKVKIPDGKLRLDLILGYSNKSNDIDNAIKILVDIFQKRFKFNDKNIYQLYVEKVIVKKGKEFFCFEFTEIK